MSQVLIDHYLAACVKAVTQDECLPPWPSDWTQADSTPIIARIKFHGIALLLANKVAALAGWPLDVVTAVKEEARLQAIWEASHSRAIARLIEALHAAGMTAVLMKGTALAYSAYSDPAIRRRGDTDILLSGVSKRAARSVLTQCGFRPSDERGPTQEPWALSARGGFEHEIDIHWRISSTLVVAQALEGLRPESRIMPLPRLSPVACGLGPIDNLILTCVNRVAHEAYGYFVEDDRPVDGDRLIWALDIDLVSRNFDDADWTLLADLAAASGTVGVVRSGLLFAGAQLGTMAPDWVLERLSRPGSHEPVGDYFGPSSEFEKFKGNLAASGTLGEKMTLLKQQVLKSRRFLREKYPDAAHWPLWALRVRRLTSVGLKLLRLRS
jgi:hypothetical protein